jgi:hypothetical protein
VELVTDARSGYSHSTMNSDERMQRESSLIATIRRKLPDFAKVCADEAELVLLQQDAFAADYQEDEYALLGMAIKYSCLTRQGSACHREESEQLCRRRENSVSERRR